ncbi:aquaporin family protein [Microbispora cellulosiformans]|uniref:Aquaporin family protein n=1 Tax=Microbispora cellulosiformans TaxID=2614688 RepID=A0A5J5JVW4_9ACTN|nr:aquaporin family protein [Microbispora cellulosiformans]
MVRPALPRRALAEYVGTLLLVTVVVGSGIMAQELSPDDVGLQLLENSTATVFGLGVLILVLGPISGAHFNPVVTLADWWAHRELSLSDVGVYVAAQIAGAVSGAVLANAMFGRAAVSWSTHNRSAGHLLIGEAVATAGLVLVIFLLVRAENARLAPVAVASYIGAAYWFTSSTSFANPAVTVGRAFSDTFAGIAPSSVPGFVVAQMVGGVIGLALVAGLYGRNPGALPAGQVDADPLLADRTL